jgi:hypothetical protein
VQFTLSEDSTVRVHHVVATRFVVSAAPTVHTIGLGYIMKGRVSRSTEAETSEDRSQPIKVWLLSSAPTPMLCFYLSSGGFLDPLRSELTLIHYSSCNSGAK